MKAQPGTHFKSIILEEVTFDDCQDEQTFTVDLIEYSMETPKCSFVLELTLPNSLDDSQFSGCSAGSGKSDKTVERKVRISKKNQCIVTIGDTSAIK